MHRREWETSTFDFATLGAKHNLHFSWHLLEIFMKSCQLEFEVHDATNVSTAKQRAATLQAMLYIQGVSAFSMPVVMSHGLRDYSGINFRESDSLRDKLPVELQTGFVSIDGLIEGWLHEPSLGIVGAKAGSIMTEQSFREAALKAEIWPALERKHQRLKVARLALQTAPMIPDQSSSLLHLWQGIESLFPQVAAELSFRLALYISQLCRPIRSNRMDTYQLAKRSYRMRSHAAHGESHKIDAQGWEEARQLLALCLGACLERSDLPSENVLTTELLE